MGSSFGKLFGKDKKVTQPTSYDTLPAFARTGISDLYNQAKDFGYSDEYFRPADFTSQQTQAMNYFQNPVQQLTPERFNTSLSMFQNPYIQSVLDPLIQDLQTQAMGEQSRIGEYAGAAGGFGGTRQAILEAELQKNLQKQIANTSANVRATAYESAADKALNRINQEENIQRQNMGSLFDIGSMLQQQNTQRQQAPLLAHQVALANRQNALAMVPHGGGTVSYQPQTGALSRLAGGFGDIGSIIGTGGSLSNIMGNFGGMGGGATASSWLNPDMGETLPWADGGQGTNLGSAMPWLNQGQGTDLGDAMPWLQGGGTGVSTGNSGGGFLSGLGNMFGGGGGGSGGGSGTMHSADWIKLAAQVAGMVFSDSSIKENIVYIGEQNGHHIYEYSYEGFPDERYRGVMAQDILETNPDAVIEENGKYMVDYKKLGVDFVRVE